MPILERIMLVDDDAFTNLFNKIVLEKANLAGDIIVYQNGREALDYLDQCIEKVDLILLDINMPIMNGWEFLEEFDKLDEYKKVAIVVMLTSSISSEDRERAERIPSVKKFISKPLSPESIKEIKDLF